MSSTSDYRTTTGPLGRKIEQPVAKVRVPYTVHVEKRIPKIIEVPVDKPFNVYVPKPYPVIVEKKVPYEIKVPLPQPYTVEKKVPYPVKVLVDKPYTLHVPKPYPVEVEKKFEFEVEKKVPVEVKVPVERRYPVHVIVEKEVKFPVEKKIPVPVKVPHDKPIPIHVTKHVPVHVDKPVPYTVEKVSTYPVNVPFRIPIKVHYQEGGSMDELYSNSFSASEMQNLEWSEAMASASKAIRSHEQNRFRSPVRHGFSHPFQRGSYSKNAYLLSQSAKKRPYFQNHHTNNRIPTKLHQVLPQSTYEVNEAQTALRKCTSYAVLSKPDSEIIVPQLLIGSPPQQSTNMLLSQAALASIVQTRNNDAKIRHSASHYRNEGSPATVTQSEHTISDQLCTLLQLIIKTKVHLSRFPIQCNTILVHPSIRQQRLRIYHHPLTNSTSSQIKIPMKFKMGSKALIEGEAELNQQT
ncbi:hypothetical protein GE061_009792 [Apolygus lucorum]|uniref:Uncharacterized protein n=1 Tax=Apolygus lucorum TaxID=248454 RepID=A0A8S9Y1I5_APOLU|nr:hypothetical protein GE061_009792 [Apolygus lucorum]